MLMTNTFLLNKEKLSRTSNDSLELLQNSETIHTWYQKWPLEENITPVWCSLAFLKGSDQLTVIKRSGGSAELLIISEQKLGKRPYAEYVVSCKDSILKLAFCFWNSSKYEWPHSIAFENFIPMRSKANELNPCE